MSEAGNSEGRRTERIGVIELTDRYASKDGLQAFVLGRPRDRRTDRLTTRKKLEERLPAMTSRGERPSMLREGKYMRDAKRADQGGVVRLRMIERI